MTETSINYAKALYELSVPEEAVLETEKIFRSTPQLKGALENPLVSLKEKEHVIDRVFPQEMKNFLKVTCKYQKISSIYDILEAYGNYSRKQKGILKAAKNRIKKRTGRSTEREDGRFPSQGIWSKGSNPYSQRRQIFDRRLHSFCRRQRVRLESPRTL